MEVNKELLEELRNQGKTHREMVDITGYTTAQVYGYFYRKYGKSAIRKKPKQSIPINQEQKEILFGTLMGDGNLQKTKYSFLGRNNHPVRQVTYCKHKRDKFGLLSGDVAFSKVIVNQKEYEICYFCFRSNTNLEDFYNMFYYKGYRDVPKDLSLLTPRAMAYWFMDDGSARSGSSISIATCSFSLEGLLRLQEFLLNTYGFKTTITKEFKLDFNAESGRKFYDIVKDFIIPEMQYKFKDLNF